MRRTGAASALGWRAGAAMGESGLPAMTSEELGACRAAPSGASDRPQQDAADGVELSACPPQHGGTTFGASWHPGLAQSIVAAQAVQLANDGPATPISRASSRIAAMRDCPVRLMNATLSASAPPVAVFWGGVSILPVEVGHLTTQPAPATTGEYECSSPARRPPDRGSG